MNRLVIGSNVLSVGTNIGKGFFLAHPLGIVINGECSIGDFVWLYQGVTLAKMYGEGSPNVGNNVIIFSGAKVVGNVRIGNNVVIGANAVVTHDIPDGGVAVGVPAKVINYNGLKINLMYKTFLKDKFKCLL